MLFEATAQTATADLPFHINFFIIPSPFLFTLATPTASQPPSLLTRDIQILGEDCALMEWGNNGVWTYRGNTADGRPHYHNEALAIMGLRESGDYYLYYDANCDGKTGDAHSKNGYPQWVISRYEPNLTREYDLEGDGKCVRDIAEAALYSIQASYDWTFTLGDQNVACPHAFGDPNWDTPILYGGLVGCPDPQPTYTLGWGDWASTDGKECGGTEVRMQIEVCADTSPKKDCPCKGRRDPAFPLGSMTRAQTKCATTTSTTSTTTTTTKIQTTSTSSSSSSSSASTSFSIPLTTITTKRSTAFAVPFTSSTAQPPTLTTTTITPLSNASQDDEGGGADTGANGGGGMGGGTIAALIILACVVLLSAAVVLINKITTDGVDAHLQQQQPEEPAGVVQNKVFSAAEYASWSGQQWQLDYDNGLVPGAADHPTPRRSWLMQAGEDVTSTDYLVPGGGGGGGGDGGNVVYAIPMDSGGGAGTDGNARPETVYAVPMHAPHHIMLDDAGYVAGGEMMHGSLSTPAVEGDDIYAVPAEGRGKNRGAVRNLTYGVPGQNDSSV